MWQKNTHLIRDQSRILGKVHQRSHQIDPNKRLRCLQPQYCTEALCIWQSFGFLGVSNCRCNAGVAKERSFVTSSEFCLLPASEGGWLRFQHSRRAWGCMPPGYSPRKRAVVHLIIDQLLSLSLQKVTASNKSQGWPTSSTLGYLQPVNTIPPIRFWLPHTSCWGVRRKHGLKLRKSEE